MTAVVDIRTLPGERYARNVADTMLMAGGTDPTMNPKLSDLAASLQGRHLCPGPHARRGVGFGGRLQQHVPDLPRQHQAIRGDLALQGLVLCGVSPYLHAGAAAACELEQSGG